ncbi:hypothetical protein GOP47_0021614 [Adiantum capillus-veneris]|uniref:Uncharacterized protein n=1 Tax=Adiantum capillus-veneris TaxID=13818 RepID=A0A9D4Z748_ADICA|nr:hypothetical protein GOP47_0021614 [Adiantum capillus-veneris]
MREARDQVGGLQKPQRAALEEDHQLCKKKNAPYHKAFRFMISLQKDKPWLLTTSHDDRRSLLILEIALC